MITLSRHHGRVSFSVCSQAMPRVCYRGNVGNPGELWLFRIMYRGMSDTRKASGERGDTTQALLDLPHGWKGMKTWQNVKLHNTTGLNYPRD